MTDADVPTRSADRRGRVLLGLAAVAVGFAAADTYVVVLALPDMMGVGRPDTDELQRAAPIISGFLLGYIAMLPLIGRIADLRGRLPVLPGRSSSSRSAHWSRPRSTTWSRMVSVASSRASGVAVSSRDARPGRRPIAAPPRACRSAWSAPCRSSERRSARCTARWCSRSRLAHDLLDQPRGRAGAGRGDPPARAVGTDAEVPRPDRSTGPALAWPGAPFRASSR